MAPSGFFRADLEQALPSLNLRWLLSDFGRRGSLKDAAKQHLLAANLGFNRTHQQIVFQAQRAFFAQTSLNAKIAVAESAVESARNPARSGGKPAAERHRHPPRCRPRSPAGGAGGVRPRGHALAKTLETLATRAAPGSGPATADLQSALVALERSVADGLPIQTGASTVDDIALGLPRPRRRAEAARGGVPRAGTSVLKPGDARA